MKKGDTVQGRTLFKEIRYLSQTFSLYQIGCTWIIQQSQIKLQIAEEARGSARKWEIKVAQIPC